MNKKREEDMRNFILDVFPVLIIKQDKIRRSHERPSDVYFLSYLLSY